MPTGAQFPLKGGTKAPMGISKLVTRRGFEPRTHCLKGTDIATDTKSYTVF